MPELVFNKDEDLEEYVIDIKVPSVLNDNIHMSLDTGSPISIICIQNLVKISGESRISLLHKIERAIASGNAVEFGVYGSQDHNTTRKFVPYLLNDVVIGGQIIKFFLIWVDVTNYIEQTSITSTLFGFDYIKHNYQGV